MFTTETATNTYDSTAADGHGGFANVGKLSDAGRAVAQHVRGGVTIPAVNAIRRYDYDTSGRLTKERHIGVNGADRILQHEYWPSGALRRKQLASGLWTGLSFNYPQIWLP